MMSDRNLQKKNTVQLPFNKIPLDTLTIQAEKIPKSLKDS